MKEKKGLGPVIAIVLLLIIAVFSVITFQSWFQSYSSEIFTNSELETNKALNNQIIDGIYDSTLFIKNPEKKVLFVKSVKIGGNDCGISDDYSGDIIEISVGNCLENIEIGSNVDVVVVTDNKILNKKEVLKKEIKYELKEINNFKNDTTLRGVSSGYIYNGYLYGSSHINNLIGIYDISNPNNILHILPDFENITTIIPLIRPNNIFVENDILYFVSNNGLVLLDVSNPVNVKQVNYYPMTSNFSSPSSIYVSEEKAFITGSSSDSLFILDVSNPENLVDLGVYKNTSNLDSPSDVIVSGIFAYVTAEFSDSLTILDISDPTNITLVDFYNSSSLDFAFSIKKSNNYVYIRGDGVITSLDISNPYNITEVDSYSSNNLEIIGTIAISGNYLFSSSWNNNTVIVLDISNPQNIKLKEEYIVEKINRSYKIFVEKEKVYLFSYFDNSVVIFNIFS